MISFELEGHKYKTPNGWKDVKFSKFLQFLEDVLPKCPKQLNALYSSENMANDWDNMAKRNKARCYQYFALSVGFWCGLPADIIMQVMDKEQLSAAYWAIDVDLSLDNAAVNEDFTGFEMGKVEYLLPQKHMIGSTVVEFTESAHFEHQMEDVKNGNWLALLDVMAVICRPKGEVYSYKKDHHEMRKNIFKNVTMDIVLNVSFFLFRLNEILNHNLLIYSLLRTKEQNEADRSIKNTAGL